MEDNFIRENIFTNYPWLNAQNADTHYIVIGDDLDSILSAFIWNAQCGNDCEIIGIYFEYTYLYVNSNHVPDLNRSVWLDLDIAQNNILSLGHHILRIRQTDTHPAERAGLNLNERRGIYHGSFRRKYPLGTIHFLMHLFNQGIPEMEHAPSLIFLADSTWINGQSHRFRNNVSDWLENCIPQDSLLETFARSDTIEFEREMQNLINRLNDMGIPRGTGQVVSRHLHLGGYQFKFSPNNLDYLIRLFEVIEELTGWAPPAINRENFTLHSTGTRRSGLFADIIYNNYPSLDDFIQGEDIFSYVIPNGRTVNYTTGIHI